MGISVDRAERVLRRGADVVAAAVDKLEAGQFKDRALAVRNLFQNLTWSVAKNGRVYALEDGTTSSSILVLVPDREVHNIGVYESFQTHPYHDGTIHIYVRTVSFTNLWAGLGLFHELSHAHDFSSGAEPLDPTEDEYRRGEARAYHLEMMLLNQLTAGRHAAALESVVAEPLDPTKILNGKREVVSNVERITAGPSSIPPASNHESDLRQGFFAAATLIASHLGVADPQGIEDPEHASEPLGEFLRSAPNG